MSISRLREQTYLKEFRGHDLEILQGGQFASVQVELVECPAEGANVLAVVVAQDLVTQLNG